MQLAAYLHGAPGRLPFIGHFRSGRQGDSLCMAIAGSVACRADVATAFRAAREIETVINGVQLSAYGDRHQLLSATWSALSAIDGCDLGPESGSDICALFTVSDLAGIGIAGVGLGGVWSWDDSGLQPLVTGDHPLLCGPGLPDRLPGVLTLDVPAHRFVAVPHDHPVPSVTLQDLPEKCGVRP